MKNTLPSFLQNAESSAVTTKALQITQIFALADLGPKPAQLFFKN